MALPKDWQAAADHVVALHAAIKDTREDIFNEMEAVERAYYGDMAIPLPQIEKSEAPAIANLIYAGIEHGFNNDTTPRYDEEAAKLAWRRTISFFDTHLRK